jgi:hypothetical protein
MAKKAKETLEKDAFFMNWERRKTAPTKIDDQMRARLEEEQKSNRWIKPAILGVNAALTPARLVSLDNPSLNKYIASQAVARAALGIGAGFILNMLNKRKLENADTYTIGT